MKENYLKYFIIDFVVIDEIKYKRIPIQYKIHILEDSNTIINNNIEKNLINFFDFIKIIIKINININIVKIFKGAKKKFNIF